MILLTCNLSMSTYYGDTQYNFVDMQQTKLSKQKKIVYHFKAHVNIIISHVDMDMLHVNIIMLHVDINKWHVNISTLQYDFADMQQTKFKSHVNIIISHADMDTLHVNMIMLYVVINKWYVT